MADIKFSHNLIDSLNLQKNKFLNIIGGGGKTSLMYALTSGLQDKSKIVFGTSTKILTPFVSNNSPLIILKNECHYGIQGFVDKINQGFESSNSICIGSSLINENAKLCGLSPDILDEVFKNCNQDYLFIEADGSKGRSLKAHYDHEPVISSTVQGVVIIIGIDILGKSLDDENIFRAKHFSEIIGVDLGTEITADAICSIIFHQDGYMKKIPDKSEVFILFSKVYNHDDLEAAKRVASHIYSRDKYDRIKKIIAWNKKSILNCFYLALQR